MSSFACTPSFTCSCSFTCSNAAVDARLLHVLGVVVAGPGTGRAGRLAGLGAP